MIKGKFTITFTIIFFTAITFTKGCEVCLPKEKCYTFGRLNQAAQNAWKIKFPCAQPQEKELSKDFGFVPITKEEYKITHAYLQVCCSDAIPATMKKSRPSEEITSTLTIKKSHADYNNNLKNYNYQRANNTYVDSRTPNSYANRSISHNRGNQYQNNGGYYGRRMNNNQYYYNQENPVYRTQKAQFLPRNRFYMNDVSRVTSNPFFPVSRAGNNVNYVDQGGQCTITILPPEPKTGCCGREASDTDRITGREHQVRSSAPTNYGDNIWTPFPHWIPNMGMGLNRFHRSVGDEKVEVTIDNRIAGGRETELEQFPWTVLLYIFIDYGNKRASFNCGGSLISSRYVLTAGHCVYDEEGKVIDVDVYIAEYDKRTFPTDCKTVLGQGRKCITNLVIKADRIILHSQYEDSQLQNDIALIRLRENTPYTNYIRPICLPSLNLDSTQFFNLRLTVAGWGKNGRYRSDIKQSTILNLVPYQECRKFYPFLTNKNLCAAGYSGEDTCKGDSGGPLMTVNGGKYEIVGIVSGKRADSPCGTAIPSLYINVYHYLDWIHNNIKN